LESKESKGILGIQGNLVEFRIPGFRAFPLGLIFEERKFLNLF